MNISGRHHNTPPAEEPEMTNNTVPYRAALKLTREASVGLSDWDAETLEMYIDNLYERRADRGVCMDQLEEAFDVYFTCYYRAGWTLMGRARAEDKAQSDAIIKAVNEAAFAAALAEEGVCDCGCGEVAEEVDAIIKDGTDWNECDDFDTLFPANVEVEVEVDDIELTEDMEDEDDIVLSPSWFVPAPVPAPAPRRSRFARSVEYAFAAASATYALMAADLYFTYGVLPF